MKKNEKKESKKEQQNEEEEERTWRSKEWKNKMSARNKNVDDFGNTKLVRKQILLFFILYYIRNCFAVVTQMDKEEASLTLQVNQDSPRFCFCWLLSTVSNPLFKK